MATALPADDEPARAQLARLLLEGARRLRTKRAEGPPAQAPTTATGTVTFRCGASGVVVYPRRARDALERFRRAVRSRDCPGCAQGQHGPWWRVEVKDAGEAPWRWDALDIRRSRRWEEWGGD